MKLSRVYFFGEHAKKKKITLNLVLFLVLKSSSNTNEGHKPTYELAISFLWQ